MLMKSLTALNIHLWSFRSSEAVPLESGAKGSLSYTSYFGHSLSKNIYLKLLTFISFSGSVSAVTCHERKKVDLNNYYLNNLNECYSNIRHAG